MAQTKSSTAGAEFENWVRIAFKRIGFKVSGGPKLVVGGFQIDCAAGSDDVLIVVECTQSGRDTASIRNRINEVRGKVAEIRKGFRKLDDYRFYTRFVFAIATNIPVNPNDEVLARVAPRIHLIDQQALQYYERLQNVIHKRAALYNLLGELEVEPRDLEFPRVPAFQVPLGKYGPAYLFWCDPQELLKIAYVARRESGMTHYYQRLLTAERLRSVRRYIDKGEIFPNNIIIAFSDVKPTFRPKPPYEEGFPNWLTFGELQFPKSYRSAWIIDGQHRLYAFGLKDSNPKDQKLAVLAFQGMDLSNQAKFFIDINHEQKPVDKDLIFDLEGDLRPETEDGKIANCIKSLNNLEPIKGSIYLPLSGKRQRGQLKLSGLVIDMRETGLLNERTRNMTQMQRNSLAIGGDVKNGPRRAASVLASFLSAIESKSDESLWKLVLLTPGGMTLLLHVYERILVHTKGKAPNANQEGRYSASLLDAITALVSAAGGSRNFVRELTSYAQRRELTKEILRRMQADLKDKSFAADVTDQADPWFLTLSEFERKFAEFICRTLGVNTISELKSWAPDDVWRRVESMLKTKRRSEPEFEVHQALTLGEILQILERKPASDVAMPLLTNPAGFGSRAEVLANLGAIIRARNEAAHGRAGGRTELVSTLLSTFRSAIN